MTTLRHELPHGSHPQPLAVSLRKKDDICENENVLDVSFYHNMVKDYTNYDIINKSFKYIMTYIACGKYNKKPFLMVDSVVTSNENNEKKYHYREKLTKLISTKNETFFTVMGTDAFVYAINLYDRKCHINKEIFNITNINQINEILELYKLIIKRVEYHRNTLRENSFNRIYFIDNNSVYYYTITEQIKVMPMVELEDNQIIKPYSSFDTPNNIKKSFINDDELIDYCKILINDNQEYGFDLKNRFSFILFDNDYRKFICSSNDNEESVLSLLTVNYDELKPNP